MELLEAGGVVIVRGSSRWKTTESTAARLAPVGRPTRDMFRERQPAADMTMLETVPPLAGDPAVVHFRHCGSRLIPRSGLAAATMSKRSIHPRDRTHLRA